METLPERGARHQREQRAHLLTVILPNYNHAALLPRALEALLAQERAPDEIILIDDASTDESLTVAEAFARRSPSIRLVANVQNLGVVAALQRGLESARGRYVYFAASDDWVLPGFFAHAVAMLEEHPQAAFFCGDAVLIEGETGRLCGYRPIARPAARAAEVSPGASRALLARIDNWILTGSAVFRRETVIAAGGLDMQLGAFADGYLARKIALKHGFYYAPQPVAVWCVFRSSVSRTMALTRAEEALGLMSRTIANDPDFPPWYVDLFERRWRFGTARLGLESRPPDKGLVASMGARTPFDRTVLAVTWTVFGTSLARPVILAWLWFRLRPTALARVLATAVQRKLERLRHAGETFGGGYLVPRRPSDDPEAGAGPLPRRSGKR